MDTVSELTRELLRMGPTTSWRIGPAGADAELLARVLAGAGVDGRVVTIGGDDPIGTLTIFNPAGTPLPDEAFWLRQVMTNACKGLGIAVNQLLQRAMGMQNIRLSATGHFMTPPPKDGKFDGVCDDDKLRDRAYVGKHAYCGGEMHFFGATMDTNVIVCRKCCFRSLEFPIQIKTYADLRKYMLEQTTPSD